MRDFKSTFRTDGANFPLTRAINDTAIGAKDGTEYVFEILDTLWGFAQASLSQNGATPNGSPETATNSQILTNILAMATAGLPIGFISGCIIANNSTDANRDIDFGTGLARSSDNLATIDFDTALTKQIDATFTIGNNAGGLASPLTVSANTTYHLFVLLNPTSSNTEAGFDTSLTATNLLADANVITGGYTKYRRIGSIITDASSNIVQFTAYETSGGGVKIGYATKIQDFSISSTSFASYNLSIPQGIKLDVLMEVSHSGLNANNRGELRTNSNFFTNQAGSYTGYETIQTWGQVKILSLDGTIEARRLAGTNFIGNTLEYTDGRV